MKQTRSVTDEDIKALALRELRSMQAKVNGGLEQVMNIRRDGGVHGYEITFVMRLIPRKERQENV